MHPRIHAGTNPDRPAIIDTQSGAVMSFGELERAANRGAHALRALGVGPRGVVALACENRFAFMVAYWAAQRAGIILVTVSTRLTAAEMSYILADSGTELLLISTTLPAAQSGLADLRAGLPRLSVVSIGPAAGVRDWETLLADQPDTPIADESAGCRMVYSSGTTGRPKGLLKGAVGGPVVRATGPAAMLRDNYGITPDDYYLSSAPLYHTAPLTWGVAAQEIGATLVMMPRFDPLEFLSAVKRWRVTAAQLVPTMFIRLLRLPPETRAKADLSSLRRVVHAAAPCPVPVKHAMIEWLGPILTEYYAGSEGNGSTLIHSDEWLRKPGSVGRSIMGVLHICDDAGHALPANEIGTIYFEGGGQFAYHNDDDKTRKSRNPLHPEWSTMGDLGYVDDDGFLFLSDRKDFMIISGGVNIYPQEIENVLLAHPAVADAAVFGVPNAEFGEEVKAVVQPVRWEDAGKELATRLTSWCREQLADFKCPRSIDFEPALPRAETGKLYKKALKAQYWPSETVDGQSPRGGGA